MPLTVQELNVGIEYWRGTNWPQNFHNSFYREMSDSNPRGNFTEEWFEWFLPILKKWIAIRPRSGSYITQRAIVRFERLCHAWVDIISPLLVFDIAAIEWRQIQAFPILVAEIKDVASPVFASKFCHFLAPQIFPVIDNAAMGKPFDSYEEYFLAGRSEWLQTPTLERVQLNQILTGAVGAPLFAGYPMKCKLIELCLIGRKQIKKVRRKTREEKRRRSSI